MDSHIKALLVDLPRLPGVYRMQDCDGQLLYIGKAKNLRARVSSYFNKSDHGLKTRHLVARIAGIEITITGSETEALLLEQTLIKRYKPPYNILLRDDKSYPYIFISQHEFPRIGSMRGRQSNGRTFGPFPNGSAVRFSLGVLQKAFRVRQCNDAYFRNRTRPCLEYQINRCSGPCVGLVSQEAYEQSVQDTIRFLEGHTSELMSDLTARMESASESMDYELAAKIRDQIGVLRQIQELQHIDTAAGSVDVFAVCQDSHFICVQTLVVRNGQIIGGQSHFQKAQLDVSEPEVLETFIVQYYLGSSGRTERPDQIIPSHPLPDPAALESVLQEVLGRTKAPPHILKRAQGHKQAWLNMAKQNAEQGLNSRRVSQARRSEVYAALRNWLMPQIPEDCVERFECYDISHSQGEATRASAVVFDEEGPRKDLYRHYSIQTAAAGDDYQAMREVIQRRFERVQHGEWPWLVIVDGGLGQLRQVAQVLKHADWNIPELCLIGLAKGPTRKAGFERIYRVNSLAQFCAVEQEDEISQIEEVAKPENEGPLRLLHEIRDESHRFAVYGHRKARDKARTRSSLETIPGVGPKRRSALLRYFGGLQGVKRASIEELSKVQGIQRSLAEVIYHSLR